MPIFNYKAKDKYGVDITGSMESNNSSMVASRLTEMGYTPVFIFEQEPSIFAPVEKFFSNMQRIKTEEMIVFVRQLSSILAAGVPLLESLEAVYEQVATPKFKAIIFDMRQKIEGGASFSEALAMHKKVFPNVFVSMVRAGERAGILGEVLERLGSLMETDFENLRKIQSATRYPIMVISALVIAFIIVVTFVIPKFSSLFASFKVELPLPTRMLLATNYAVTNYWYIIIAVVIAVVYSFRRFVGSKTGRIYYDRFKLSIPVIGPLVNKLMLARLCRILSAMLKSGIPIIEALSITEDTIDNAILSKVMEDVKVSVSKGSGLSEPMRGAKVFPPLVIQMVTIGEKSGSLESMLSKVADYFDRDTDYTIRNLTPLLEPLLILVLGVFVVILALGVYLPMWDMIKIIK